MLGDVGAGAGEGRTELDRGRDRERKIWWNGVKANHGVTCNASDQTTSTVDIQASAEQSPR